MSRTGDSGFGFKKVTSKAGVEYGLKRVETGDRKDCEEVGVPKSLGLHVYVCLCVLIYVSLRACGSVFFPVCVFMSLGLCSWLTPCPGF